MKKILFLALFILTACGRDPQSPSAGASPSPQAGCAALVSEVQTLSGLKPPEFVQGMTLLLEKNAASCSVESAAAVLDEKFILECRDLCLIKGKEL